jgi:hypothetical protein
LSFKILLTEVEINYVELKRKDKEMALLLTQVTQWVDNRDSKKRVHKRDIWATDYREFLINPNRITDLKAFGNGSQFLFSDNHRDRRENNSYLRTNSTVAEIITAHDTDFASLFVTLPFCPKNNPAKTPVDTTIAVEDIAYFDRYNDDPDNFVWLVYDRKAFRRVEQLVAYNIEQAEDVVNDGETTTTTTTPDEQ